MADIFDNYIQLHKDICQMEDSELRPVLDNVLGLTASANASYLSTFRSYGKWSYSINKTPNAKTVLAKYKPTENNFLKFRQQSVANPKQLQNYLQWWLRKKE